MKHILPLALAACTFCSLTSVAQTSGNKVTKPKAPKTAKAIMKALDDSYVYVPSGSMTLDSTTVSCRAFFISKGEITNGEYRAFINDLKAKGDTEKLKIAQVDTLKWNNSSLGYGQPYVEYYSNHPAYTNYPVVNISYEGAQLYCEWLSEKMRQETGNATIQFRLPLRNEFLRAANGDHQRSYAWNDPFIRDNQGRFRCNHMTVGNERIHYNAETKTYEVMPYTDGMGGTPGDLTAPSISFWENEFGIYNLNGNVSEMVSEKGIAVGGAWNSPGYDVRNESITTYTEASPMIGFRPVMTFIENGAF